MGFEGSDPCIHPCAMKQSPVGGLAMDREQLRGCSQSLLMQEVRYRELSPGFLTQYCAKNQVRQGNTHPTSQSRQFRGGLPTTSHHVDTHFLLWMAPLRRCPTPLLVGMMHPCILPSHFPLSPVDGAAAAPSYTFTWGWCIPASYLATTHFLLWMMHPYILLFFFFLIPFLSC